MAVGAERRVCNTLEGAQAVMPVGEDLAACLALELCCSHKHTGGMQMNRN